MDQVGVSAPGHVRRTLESLCAAGVSGALRVPGEPAGTIYLSQGRVAFAECPLATDVERLLTASGRLAPEAWRAAVEIGGADGRVGDVLVDGGHLTGYELELCLLTAALDAMFFLLDAHTTGPFDSGASHSFGAVRTLDFEELCAEIDRRRRLLDEAWPGVVVDTTPVLPVRRLSGQYVNLTAVQWEIVVNADGRRGAVELARRLGRGTYPVLLDIRRLAAAGVIQVAPGRRDPPVSAPRAEPPVFTPPMPAPREPPMPASRAEPPMPASRAEPPVPAPRAEPPVPAPRAEPPRRSNRRGPPPPPPIGSLPHRGVDAKAPWLGDNGPARPTGCEFSESTLLRIRDALEALK